jgi:NDP-sugar pyrophosphorylase family protein
LRAIILGGGKGVRLAPLTEVIPKPLVPLGGMPILEIVIRQLQYYGFRHLTLAVGYMADLIQAYFQDGAKWGLKIDYSYESTPLGTAGPLALVQGLNDTLLVMNADVLTSIDYNALVKYHRERGAIATVAALERQATIDFGIIISDGQGRIRDYVEKPTTTHLVSMGVYIFEPQVLEYIRGRGYLDFPDLVKLLLQDDRPVHYYPFTGYWLDIGRHDDYAQAAAEFEEKKDQLNLLTER